jgi:cold shock protein
MTGTIKIVHSDKGYGFIRGEDGKDYFFHRSGLKNCQLADLEQGVEVTFEDTETKNGPRAEDVFI